MKEARNKVIRGMAGTIIPDEVEAEAWSVLVMLCDQREEEGD